MVIIKIGKHGIPVEFNLVSETETEITVSDKDHNLWTYKKDKIQVLTRSKLIKFQQENLQGSIEYVETLLSTVDAGTIGRIDIDAFKVALSTVLSAARHTHLSLLKETVRHAEVEATGFEEAIIEFIKEKIKEGNLECARNTAEWFTNCLLYTSPSPRDKRQSRMPSSA